MLLKTLCRLLFRLGYEFKLTCRNLIIVNGGGSILLHSKSSDRSYDLTAGIQRLAYRASMSGVRFGTSVFPFMFFLCFVVLCSVPMCAVNPVIFDFEDLASQSAWQLNVNGQTIQNRWCFTTAEQYMGATSMVISSSPTTAVPPASYVNTGANVAVAAVTHITLPKGTYDLSFAWKCAGEGSSDGFYVYWESEGNSISSSMAGLPQNLVGRALTFSGGRQFLNGKSSWQTEMITITSDGNSRQLAFVWLNNGSVTAQPSACIDFVQIAESKVCTKPSSVAVASTIYAEVVGITWSGVAEEYQFMYRRNGDTSLPTICDNITTRSYSITESTYGLYDFFVRGICGADTSVWVSYCNHLIYAPGCIDYANLYSDKVSCSYNVRAEGEVDERGDQKFPPIAASQWRVGVVDLGSQSMYSRHTVHTIPEMDPRTNYGLPTIPPGEVVSVRLGNWNMGAESERITYKITADSAYRVILLKYAVVFEDPSHTELDQPRFTLRITNRRGEPLGGICGKEDFRPSVNLAEGEGWHEYRPVGSEANVVRWKEWTTVGIRIPDEELGNELSIELQSYDCEQGGHYGYAYFTLSCVSATISGIACGEQPVQTISAPPGFTYEWYLDDPADPIDQDNVLFTTQTINVDGKDTRTYYCDCNFITTNADKLGQCGFTLSANMTPRMPKASGILQHNPSKCERNAVKFNNVSAVVTDEGIPMGGEQCDFYQWQIVGVDADSVYVPIDKNPTVLFPRGGGDYTVRLIAGMSNGNCMDSIDIPLHVPSLFPKETWIDTVVCGKYPFRWNGRTYRESALDTVSYMMSGGCDSTIYLRLTMLEEMADTVTDTICQGMVYDFHGQQCSSTGVYTHVVPAAQSSMCDSTYYLNLTVIDSLSIQVTPFAQICADDSHLPLSFTVSQGEYLSATIDFDTLAERVGFVDNVLVGMDVTELSLAIPAGVRPDWYAFDLRFATEWCDTTVYHIPFCVFYPDDVLRQKWNDVIAVYNENYNGGYRFSAFEWYCNGMLIDGETGSYYYLGKDRSFDYANAVEYSAGLRRQGEDYYIRTCPITPSLHADLSQYPTITAVFVGQRLSLPAIESTEPTLDARWWSVSGQLVASQHTSASAPQLTAPAASGFYILELTSGTTSRVIKVQVR